MSSRFEFLGSTALGQYIPRPSWFHQRDPRARLLCFISLLIAMIFTPDLWGLAVGVIAIIAIYLSANLPFSSTIKGIIRVLPFILILALIQVLFNRSAQDTKILWHIWGLTISYGSLMGAGILIIRFVLLVALLNAFVMSLSTSQISAALFYLFKPLEKISFPVNDLTMVVQITLRYLPMVAQLAEKTAKAQAARGGDWEHKGGNPIKQAKQVVPLIVPIIVSSLKRAEIMAVAMESRGFNAAHERSSFYAMKFTFQDAVLLLVSLVTSTSAVIIGKIF